MITTVIGVFVARQEATVLEGLFEMICLIMLFIFLFEYYTL